MAGIPRPKLNRIPGGGMPLAKKDSYAKDLTKLTQVELLEIKEREERLLRNKSKLQKLPDKGKRIQDFYDKVLQEVDRRSNMEEAAKMFSKLNIASNGEKTLNELEWQGNLNKFENMDPLEDVVNSDDETEKDPLKIIAQRQMHQRTIKVEQPEIKLITEEDIKEIKSFKANSVDCDIAKATESGIGDEVRNSINTEIVSIDVKEKLDNIKSNLQELNNSLISSKDGSRSNSSCSHVLELEPHVHYLVDKTETQVKEPAREKFKPFRTTVSNVHDPSKEKQRKQGTHWEVTAATPPPIQHNGTQLLSLMVSVEIQAEYLSKLKELQEKQSAERLAAKVKRLENRDILLPSEEELKTKTSFTQYRNSKRLTHNIEGEQKFNEDDEVSDPLDDEKFGGVNFNVYE